MFWILDNGHGVDTPGKRSPFQPTLFEYEYNRKLVYAIHTELKRIGIKSYILVPELNDITLKERVKRINDLYKIHKDAILVSIHCNACGGTGFEIFTSRGETKSDKIAEVFCNNIKNIFKNKKLRSDKTDGDLDKEEDFYILRKTKCPAILTENLFMDNKSDYDYLMSTEGFNNIVKFHINSIVECNN